MKKAFTLIELLVVIAIIAILAAMLMPALSRARGEAERIKCASNMHNQGIAFAMFTEANDGLWPGWVGDLPARWARMGVYYPSIWAPWGTCNNPEQGSFMGGGIHDPDGPSGTINWGDYVRYDPETWCAARGGPWYQLLNEGYLDDKDVLDCPGIQGISRPRFGFGKPTVYEEGELSPLAGFDKFVGSMEYTYDLGRVHRNSNPGRVVAADQQRLMHYRNANQEDVDHDGIDHDPPHGPGANVLCADNAVQWTDKLHAHTHWRSFGEFDLVRWWGCNWRWGYVPNPRIDEDVDYASEAYLSTVENENGYGGGSVDALKTDLVTGDVDDIYVDERVYGPTADGGQAGAFIPKNLQHMVYGGWMDVWPAWAFDNWSYGGDPNAQAGPWTTNKSLYRFFQWAPCEITPRSECSMGLTQYPQRGIFATEPRWNKHDSRCITGPPWKSEFGLQGYSMYDAYAGANDPVPGED